MCVGDYEREAITCAGDNVKERCFAGCGVAAAVACCEWHGMDTAAAAMF